MNKIKVIIDASAPNYLEVKKVLEDKGMEVIVHESKFDFDVELLKQIDELKSFESLYFKNPQSQQSLQNKVSSTLAENSNNSHYGKRKLRF